MLCSACLIEEVRQDLYLSPDGSVVWVVEETNVRSDKDDRIDRDKEEQEFIRAADKSEHSAAAAFRALEPQRLESQVLRHQRPFVVRTTAEFGSISAVHGLPMSVLWPSFPGKPP